MSIYSQELQDLTDQLVAQVAQLQQAVAASDGPGITAAIDAIAQTATSLNQLVTSADVPPDNTMIFYLTNDLLAQVDQLQQADAASDSTAIAAATDAIALTTANYNQTVTRMSQTLPEVVPLPALQDVYPRPPEPPPEEPAP